MTSCSVDLFWYMTVLHSSVPQLIVSSCEIPVAFFLAGLFRGRVSWYLPLSSLNAQSCFWLLIWCCLLSGHVTENGGSEAVDLNKRSRLCTYNSHTAVCRDGYKNALITAQWLCQPGVRGLIRLSNSVSILCFWKPNSDDYCQWT